MDERDAATGTKGMLLQGGGPSKSLPFVGVCGFSTSLARRFIYLWKSQVIHC